VFLCEKHKFSFTAQSFSYTFLLILIQPHEELNPKTDCRPRPRGSPHGHLGRTRIWGKSLTGGGKVRGEKCMATHSHQEAYRPLRWKSPCHSSINSLERSRTQRPPDWDLAQLDETQTEYLWCVSVPRGHQRLLSDEEAGRFWCPGVILGDGTAGDQSITSRVAYWAGDVDPKERGEPVTIRIKGLLELAEGLQRAACVQAM